MNPAARLLLVLGAVLFGAILFFVLRPAEETPAPSAPGPLPERAEEAPPEVREERPANGTAAPETARPERTEEPLPEGLVVTGVVRDGDGRPVGGATVVLREGGSLGNRSLLSMDPDLAVVETGADGRFRFDVVPPGQICTVTAKHPDYEDASKAFELLEGADEPPELELVLAPAAVLAGTVLDPDGGPVAGATVYAIPGDAPEMLLANPDLTVSGSGGTWKARRATSGEDGRYRIGGLASGGTYLVRARAEGHAESSDVEIEAGPATTVNPRLRRPGGAVLRLRDAAGEPVLEADAVVTWKGIPERIEADGTGRMVLEGLTPGDYELRIRPARLLAQTVAFTVEPGRTTELEVVFSPGVAIAGRVVDDRGEAVPGATVEAQRPFGPEHRDLERSGGKATADGEGRFRIEGLLPGPHAVQARAEGFEGYMNGPFEAPVEDVRVEVLRWGRVVAKLVLPPGAEAPERIGVGRSSTFRNEDVWSHAGRGWSRTSVPWNGGALVLDRVPSGDRELLIRVGGLGPVSRTVRVRPGETTDLGEIRLGTAFELRGRVTDLAGEPVAGASVFASQGFSELDETATASDGTFRVGGLGEGETELSVEAEGFLPGGVTEDTRQAAAPVEIRLRRGGLLVGAVYDADGKPVPGVDVELEQTGVPEGDAWTDWIETDLRGTFRARVPAGACAVRVRRDGEVLKTVETELAEGGRHPLRIDLP